MHQNRTQSHTKQPNLTEEHNENNEIKRNRQKSRNRKTFANLLRMPFWPEYRAEGLTDSVMCERATVG